MKTSEDKMNEALRDVLKRKFDDYEEQPNPNALDRIRARVKPARPRKYWWFTGALILVSVLGVLLSRFSGEPRQQFGSAKNVHVRAAEAATTAGHSGSSHVKEPAKTLSKPSESLSKPVAGKTASKTTVLKSERENKSVFVKDVRNRSLSKVQRTHSGNLPGATGKRNERLPGAETVLKTEKHAGSGIAVNEMPAALAEEMPVHLDSNAVVMTPLEELAAMPLKETEIPLHLRGVEAPLYKPAKVILTNPARIAWLFNASALHSYQILTVPSSAAKDFQNFSFPSLFGASSIGYKVSAGVERKGIQVQLHYSGFRQTYSYEIANNNYLVKPDDNGEYHTVRQGDRMEENRQFSMLGIGVSKQVRWGHSPVSRFYATFGLEYSRALNTNQNLGWLSLGLGKQFAVTRGVAFSIGPYAEFSPVKVKSIANPFYYQPYRVGILAGLRLVKP